MSDEEILQFIYERLINVHGENPNYDYMIRFKEVINKESKQIDEMGEHYGE